MEEGKEAPSLRELVSQYYSEIVKNIDPERMAEWVITLERIKEAYPTLWNTSLSELEKLGESYPEETISMLHLFPPLAIMVTNYIDSRSKEEIETEGEVIIMAMSKVLHQLFHFVYVAGYTDGQRNPKNDVLSQA